MFVRCVLLLLVRLLPIAAGVLGTAGPSAAAAAGSGVGCARPLALLVDRSGSMAARDPSAELRLAVAAALDARRPAGVGDLVAGFADELGAFASPEPDGWSVASARALRGGDRGGTDPAVVSGARVLAGAQHRIVMVTDQEVVFAAGAAVPDVLIVLGGAAPAPAAEAVRAAGGMVGVVRSAAAAAGVVRQLCTPGSGTPAGNAVLIAGLRARVPTMRGVRSLDACGGGPLAGWCRALVAQGWRVWSPSAAPGGRGTVLDATGALEPNAAALRAWVRRERIHDPVVIGHSMGGLIGHAALRGGMDGAALLTVGTPHAGSFGADAYAAAISAAQACVVRCPATGAALLAAAAATRRRFGAALDDLTRSRRLHDAPLGAPGVPLAVWAGAVNRLPVLPAGLAMRSSGAGYLSPNDGIVGTGSASGRLARLAPVEAVTDGAARHSSNVPPAGAVTELASEAVAAWITSAAGRLAPPTGGGRAAWAGRAASAPGRSALRRVRRASVVLQAAAPLVPSAPPLRVSAGAVVVATAPIGVLCDGTSMAPIEALPGLWWLDLGALGCLRVAAEPDPLAGPSARPVLLGIATDELPARALLGATRRAHGGWRISLHAPAGWRPQLTRGRRVIRLRAAPGEWGDRRWVANLRRGGARRVLARLAHRNGSELVGALVLP